MVNASDSDVEIQPQLITERIDSIDDYIIAPLHDQEFQQEGCVSHRLKLLDENLKLDHLNEEERSSILEICREFHDLFHFTIWW